MKYYKWTADNKPICGIGKYELPKGKRKGKWMEVEGELVMCENGFHACTREQLPYFCGTELWEVELDGVLDKPDARKVCARRMRFVRKLNWSRKDMEDYAQNCADQATLCATVAARNAARAARNAAWAATWTALDAAWAARDAARERQVKWIEERVGEKL